MIKTLHPGAKPPTRHQLSGAIVHKELIEQAGNTLKNRRLTLAVDGWSKFTMIQYSVFALP